MNSQNRAVSWAAGSKAAFVGSILMALSAPAAHAAPNIVEVLRNINGQPTVVGELQPANVPPAVVLRGFDIDGDGVDDNAVDTDGDGLPDNWESGGVEGGTLDGPVVERVVPIPAPTAIVPGSVPTPLFTRVAVQTSALLADTDGDGLTDFIEVFGLKFIDDNNNGRLDADEWFDANGDGMPSIGEYPLPNILVDEFGVIVPGENDFDGFIFTDPNNADTDGDGTPDGNDADPLINPRSFGAFTNSPSIVRGGDDIDFDNDGLGNSQDFLDDERSRIDNPTDLLRIIALFRPQDLELDPVTAAESQIEDLLGVDWDGNGLWRTTDVQGWTPVIADSSYPLPGDPLTAPQLFTIQGRALFQPQSLATVQAAFANGFALTRRGLGMGYQNLFRPPGRDANPFISDPRIWTVLYSWRVPGFDIDGNGFVGVPTVSATRARTTNPPERPVLLDGAVVNSSLDATSELVGPIDQRFALAQSVDPLELDGVIETNCGAGMFGCGSGLAVGLAAGLAGLATRRRVRR